MASPGLPQDGIKINGTGIVLDGVKVADFAGRGIVVNGAAAHISRTTVEDVAHEAFVVAGANATLSGNSAKPGTQGFVVSGPDCVLDTNDAERTSGNGFVVKVVTAASDEQYGREEHGQRLRDQHQRRAV